MILTKKRLFQSFLCLLCLILGFATAEARQPAVDPVRGISIDKYKDVPPEENKGDYEFKERPQDRSQNRESMKAPASTTRPETKGPAQQTEGTDWPLGFLLIALLALPFAIWWIFQKSLQQHQSPTPNDHNTIDLSQHRERKEKSKDDYPKAS